MSAHPLPEEAAYEAKAQTELADWRAKMLREPGPWDKATRKFQDQVNHMIPDKVHAAVTAAMEQMTKAILSGSDLITGPPLQDMPLSHREARVREQLVIYRTTAAAEGGVVGLGGFLLAAADFPVLIGIKIKLLFEIAALYGHAGDDFRERLFILKIFQLAFSSAVRRADALRKLDDWAGDHSSPESFDWRAFQQEYRDYIDLAKMAQLLPVVGAPIGAAVNYGLVDRLGVAAMNAYRQRWFASEAPQGSADVHPSS